MLKFFPREAARTLLLGFALFCSAQAHSQPIASNATALSQYETPPADAGPIQRMWADQRKRENQDRNRIRVAIPHAGGAQTITQSPGPFTRLPENDSEAKAPPAPYTPNYQAVVLCLASVLMGILAVRLFGSRFAEFLNQSNPWDRELSGGVDTRAFTDFAASFRVGSTPAPSVAQKGPDSATLAEFFDRAPRLLQTLRGLAQQAARAPSQTILHTTLRDLLAQAHSLRGMSGLPALLPVWQMATGLEGLLKQLTDKMTNVTPSTMRTISGAVDLIGNLCAPSLKADLATNPPIRLLAVDDDRISRNVISFALKKSLHQPDLAEDGKAALVLAENGAYDVIFLDIQMPAMDGFELCKRIHSTNLNRQTPVVFVTCQSDFEARAQAALVGGLDLIGKPYLTFEIALKALTMVLRRRLGATQAVVVPSTETAPALGEPAAAEKKTQPASAIVSNSAKAAPSIQAASPGPIAEQPIPCPRSRRSARNRRARRRHSKIQRRLAGTTGA